MRVELSTGFTVEIQTADVEISHAPCRPLPIVATASPCARGGNAHGASKAPPPDPRTDEAARLAFFANVPPQTSTVPCWLWQGDAYPSNGYARFIYGGHSTVAYRFSFRAMVGEVPAGLRIRHICDDRRCVNPRHLVLGTRADNTRDIYVTRRALAAVRAAHAAGDRRP